jgi:hypothetical protein
MFITSFDTLVTPLMLAVKLGHYDLVSMMLSHDSSIMEVADADGDTPFIIGAKKGKFDAMKLLFEAGCDICAQNNEGKIAFEYIAEGNIFCCDEHFNEFMPSIMQWYFKKADDDSWFYNGIDIAMTHKNYRLVQLMVDDICEKNFQYYSKALELEDERLILYFARCLYCKTVPENIQDIRKCICKEAFYCNDDCQRNDWIKNLSAHKDTCNRGHRCFYCNTAGHMRRCVCKEAYYCDDECQRRDWQENLSAHKDTCNRGVSID